MNLVRLEISASAVAWYGAIIATISAIVSAYNVFRDRARILIRVNGNMKISPSRPPYNDKTYFVVSVVNCGRRPVIITHVWFEQNKKGTPKLLVADSIYKGSRELTEGKWTDYLCEQSQIEPSSKYVCVSDSTGRIYRKNISGVIKCLINNKND